MHEGIVLSLIERFDQALESFDKAIALIPDDYRVWYYRGITLYRMSQFEDALESYDKAITIDHSDDDVWRRRDYCLHDLVKQGKNELVSQSWKEFIHFKEEDAECWFSYGNSLFSLRKVREAMKCYVRAIKLAPGNETIWNKKGLAHSILHQYGEALDCLKQATDIDQDYAEA